MSNFPDNFNSTAFDRRYAEASSQELSAQAEFRRARCAIDNVIAAAQLEGAKAGLGPLNQHEIDCLRESLADTYHRQLEDSRRALRDADADVPDLYRAEA